jgi:hypothetical protein
MGFFDFLFGRKQEQAAPQQPVSFGSGPVRLGNQAEMQAAPMDENERALQRYRYMLRTAPPETIEQAHAEAFERMTPEQRTYVLQALANELPEQERAAITPEQSNPQQLARIATRAEMRNPGAVERSMAAHPSGAHGMMGGGMGGMAGTLLMSFAAGFAGSMVASAFLSSMGDPFADAGVEEFVGAEEFAQEESFGGFDDFGGDFEEF